MFSLADAQLESIKRLKAKFYELRFSHGNQTHLFVFQVDDKAPQLPAVMEDAAFSPLIHNESVHARHVLDAVLMFYLAADNGHGASQD